MSYCVARGCSKPIPQKYVITYMLRQGTRNLARVHTHIHMYRLIYINMCKWQNLAVIRRISGSTDICGDMVSEKLKNETEEKRIYMKRTLNLTLSSVRHHLRRWRFLSSQIRHKNVGCLANILPA